MVNECIIEVTVITEEHTPRHAEDPAGSNHMGIGTTVLLRLNENWLAQEIVQSATDICIFFFFFLKKNGQSPLGNTGIFWLVFLPLILKFCLPAKVLTHPPAFIVATHLTANASKGFPESTRRSNFTLKALWGDPYQKDSSGWLCFI